MLPKGGSQRAFDDHAQGHQHGGRGRQPDGEAPILDRCGALGRTPPQPRRRLWRRRPTERPLPRCLELGVPFGPQSPRAPRAPCSCCEACVAASEASVAFSAARAAASWAASVGSPSASSRSRSPAVPYGIDPGCTQPRRCLRTDRTSSGTGAASPNTDAAHAPCKSSTMRETGLTSLMWLPTRRGTCGGAPSTGTSESRTFHPMTSPRSLSAGPPLCPGSMVDVTSKYPPWSW